MSLILYTCRNVWLIMNYSRKNIGRGFFKYYKGYIYDGNSKRGHMKEDEFISFTTALFMMENIEVISQR